MELKIEKNEGKIIDIKDVILTRFENKSLINEYTPAEILMEYVGRICYNSHDKLTDTSLKPFLISAAIKGHKSLFEFSDLQFSMPFNTIFNENLNPLNHKFLSIKYKYSHKNLIFIKGSLRALIELLESYLIDINQPINIYINLYKILYTHYSYILDNWNTSKALNNLYQQLICNQNETCSNATLIDITDDYYNISPDTKILSLITCGRDTSHEIVRHRDSSLMQSSQRYVRFNKDNPYSICIGEHLINNPDFNIELFKNQLIKSFIHYTELLKTHKPEDARIVLPNCTTTTLFIYATKKEYQHIFKLRTSKYAYKPIKEIFDNIYQQMINQSIIFN